VDGARALGAAGGNMGGMANQDRALGTPYGKHPTRALLLGSGELGKEVAIALTRLGVRVIAADSYEGAPAQQVAHEAHVLDMSDAQALAELIAKVQPDIIIPEIEAIATQVLFDAERAGIHVVPSATIASICMDREALRRLASDDLGLPTSPHRFAGSLEELRAGAQAVGFPCVVKPVMSSSGHGQSVVHDASGIDAAWQEAQRGRDGGEPQGTAGRPMLEVLLGEGIHNAAVVVTRYFGGTLLGTGGLVRAYSKAVQAGLKASVIIEKQQGFLLKLETDYNGIGKIQYILGQRGIVITDSEYTEKVKVETLVPQELLDGIREEITEGTNGKAVFLACSPVCFALVDGAPVIFA